MPHIGIRELKARASEIVRGVRERRERYVITYHGRPVGVLLPIEEVDASTASIPTGDVWEELLRLGEEIERDWQSPLTSTELLSEMRR